MGSIKNFFLRMDWAVVGAWLRQPSTLKFIVAVLGALGYVIECDNLAEYLGVIIGLCALINGFYDQNPRKPE